MSLSNHDCLEIYRILRKRFGPDNALTQYAEDYYLKWKNEKKKKKGGNSEISHDKRSLA